jgi:hypothetical protein
LDRRAERCEDQDQHGWQRAGGRLILSLPLPKRKLSVV